MNTPESFNRFHHWARGANAKLLLSINHLPQWRTSAIDLHGIVYYHHSSSPENSLVVKSSPFFLPYPRRIDNDFLKHLCLLPLSEIQAFLSRQLQEFIAKGGDRNDWLHHTIELIIDFLEYSENLSSDSSNFWDSNEIAKSHRQNTFAALALLGQREFACES